MHLRHEVPFLRLLIPFLAGLLTSIYCPIPIPRIHYFILPLFGIITYWIYKRNQLSFTNSWLFGIAATLLLFITGLTYHRLKSEVPTDPDFLKRRSGEDIQLIRVLSDPIERSSTYKMTAEILGLREERSWNSIRKKSMYYFRKNEQARNIRYGDILLVQGRVSAIPGPTNPDEFNYRDYLLRHHIIAQAFVDQGHWTFTGYNEGNILLRSSIRMRDFLVDIFRKTIPGKDEFTVASALVLGSDDDLDPAVRQSYAASGALHILSVSGLHVGIVYLCFGMLLSFLDKLKYGKIIRCILLLCTVWFYAFLTGLSPSVLRSATMFSFLIIGATWTWHTNIFNTVAVSGFALLLYDPGLIQEAGFQLSYLAVLGIITIQPWIHDLWEPRLWILRQVWSILSVSMAAQAGTFPVSLYYFHQFPNYFLLTNLLVIPLSTFVLTGGIVIFLAGNVPFIGEWTGTVFSWLVSLLNGSVRLVEKLPGSLSQNIHISFTETLLLYLLMVFFIAFIASRRKFFLFLSLSTLIMFLLSRCISLTSSIQQKELIVYNVPGQSAMDLFIGRKAFVLADTPVLRNEVKGSFHIAPHRIASGIRELIPIPEDGFFRTRYGLASLYGKLVIAYGLRIASVRSLPDENGTPFPFRADVVILSGNPNLRIAHLAKWFRFSILVFDSSNKASRIRKWKKECETLGIRYHSVTEQGAFRMNLLHNGSHGLSLGREEIESEKESRRGGNIHQ